MAECRAPTKMSTVTSSSRVSKLDTKDIETRAVNEVTRSVTGDTRVVTGSGDGLILDDIKSGAKTADINQRYGTFNDIVGKDLIILSKVNVRTQNKEYVEPKF